MNSSPPHYIKEFNEKFALLLACMIDRNGHQIHYRKGAKEMFIQAFDHRKYCCVNDGHLCPGRNSGTRSKVKEFRCRLYSTKAKEDLYPPMNHPWRRQHFEKFLKQQEHHWKDSDTRTA